MVVKKQKTAGPHPVHNVYSILTINTYTEESCFPQKVAHAQVVDTKVLLLSQVFVWKGLGPGYEATMAIIRLAYNEAVWCS